MVWFEGNKHKLLAFGHKKSRAFKKYLGFQNMLLWIQVYFHYKFLQYKLQTPVSIFEANFSYTFAFYSVSEYDMTNGIDVISGTE